MFPSYRDFNLQDTNWHKTAVSSPTEIPFTVTNRYQVTSYPISDAHKFWHICTLYIHSISSEDWNPHISLFPFSGDFCYIIFLCVKKLIFHSHFHISQQYSDIRHNIVKENKSYIRICRNLEVGSDLMHTYSWHFLTFVPFFVIFPYIIFSTTFKSSNAGGSLCLEPLIVPVQSAKTLSRAVKTV